MEIVKQREAIRTDKTPSPALRVRETRDYLWMCPECRRAVRLPYNRSQPIPSCLATMDGSKWPHVKQMLVCEDYDIYAECYYRWHKRGERLGRPIIYARNQHYFPVIATGDDRREIAKVSAR